MVRGIIPRAEPLAKSLGMVDRAEAVWELRLVLERLELTL
jgi:hypothetical protein